MRLGSVARVGLRVVGVRGVQEGGVIDANTAPRGAAVELVQLVRVRVRGKG